jgi:hypothetical protein
MVVLAVSVPDDLWQVAKAGLACDEDVVTIYYRTKVIERLIEPIAELNLSLRSRKCLDRLNVRYVYDLVQRSRRDLLAVRNFGMASLAEVERLVEKKGLCLNMNLGGLLPLEAAKTLIAARLAKPDPQPAQTGAEPERMPEPKSAEIRKRSAPARNRKGERRTSNKPIRGRT